MRLNQRKISAVLLFFTLLSFGCEKQDTEIKYIARVNDSYLTEKELSEDSAEVRFKNRSQYISNWVESELLLQEAKKRGINENENFIEVSAAAQRELLKALLIEEVLQGGQIPLDEGLLEDHFKKFREDFRLFEDSFLLNRTTFLNEDKAIRFRTALFETDWERAMTFFADDPSVILSESRKLFGISDISNPDILKLAEELEINETSIVIKEKYSGFTVIQLLRRFRMNEIPDFGILTDRVKKHFLTTQRKIRYREFLSTLYAESEIEIK